MRKLTMTLLLAVLVGTALALGLVSVTRADPVGDPQGDTLGVGPVQLDISQINAVFTSTSLTLTVQFYTAIAPPWDVAPNSVIALIPLDTDQNEFTGGPFGDEFDIFLADFIAPGTVLITDAELNDVGSAPVSFTATSFTTTFPLSLIADNGLLDYLVGAGTVDPVFGGIDEITDIAPNGGVATSQPASSSPPSGDVNGDGDVTIVDLVLVAQFLGGVIGPGDLDLAAADVNDDGEVTVTDLVLVAQFLGGVIPGLPPP